MNTRTANRVKLSIIIGLFVLPLLAAWLMFTGRISLPGGDTTNAGVLVEPTIAVDWTQYPGASDLTGHWVILLEIPKPCDTSCEQRAIEIRQVHRASGREQQRIVPALVMANPNDDITQQMEELYPAFAIVADADRELTGTLREIRGSLDLQQQPQPIYLVDPLGHIMMAYDSTGAATGLRKDLKKLLKWSKQDTGRQEP